MALLEINGLTKHFGGLGALNDLNLTVEKGEIVGLIGPNGAGKTTAFNVIMGTFAPSRGSVIFQGKDITGLKPHVIVQKGVVRSFQRTILFSEMTILQNIILGFHLAAEIGFWGCLFNTVSTRNNQKAMIEKAEELADFMGLGNIKHQYAKNLPHGNQRLLGVAVALATNPTLILMDEPVTGMNAEETDSMMNKIRQIRDRGITILLVEHDMRLVMKICERLYVLNFGSKIAEGTPQQICQNREVITAYLGSEYACPS